MLIWCNKQTYMARENKFNHVKISMEVKYFDLSHAQHTNYELEIVEVLLLL